jgi:hypothetical protein
MEKSEIEDPDVINIKILEPREMGIVMTKNFTLGILKQLIYE